MSSYSRKLENPNHSYIIQILQLILMKYKNYVKIILLQADCQIWEQIDIISGAIRLLFTVINVSKLNFSLRSKSTTLVLFHKTVYNSETYQMC